MLTRLDAIHHLLRLGLLSPNDVTERHLSVSETLGRNHLIRVEKEDGAGFVIKEPRDPDEFDASTMWMEATLSWLSANDALFGRMTPWMPRFFHYHEPQKILTCELVACAEPLVSLLLAGSSVKPAVLRNVGSALGILHGLVSRGSTKAPSEQLFSPLMPWVLSLGSNTGRYAPRTPAAAEVLREIMANTAAMQQVRQLREGWRTNQVIHGDAKATNVLVLKDSSVRIVDWEISNFGDGLWDVAGIMHSLIVPNPRWHDDPLNEAINKARPLIDALWQGYLSEAAPFPDASDPRFLASRMAGARLLQTALECGYFPGPLPQSMPLLLESAFELLSYPDGTR